MSFLYLFLVGILIGAAMVIPGLSGGVIAVILGIYDKMISSLNNLFSDFKNSFSFLFVLTIGVLIGAIWFSNVLFSLYKKYEVLSQFIFIGLILGGIPCLLKRIKGNNKNYLVVLLSFLLSFIMCYLTSIIKLSISNSNSVGTLFITGLVYSVGKVIPGISSSFLLILIGKYEFVLNIIAHPITQLLGNIKMVIPFIIGLILGVLILLKIITILLNKHHEKTYSVIIGFIIGTIPTTLPNIKTLTQLYTGVLLLIISFFISYKLTCK